MFVTMDHISADGIKTLYIHRVLAFSRRSRHLPGLRRNLLHPCQLTLQVYNKIQGLGF